MAFSSMDLDSSLDDLIKQRRKQNQKPASTKKAAKQANKTKSPVKGVQTKAKVTKPNNNKNKKKNNPINSRLSQKPQPAISTKADPSQIIITKTIPSYKQKSHNNNNNNNNNNNSNSPIYSSSSNDNNSNNSKKRGFRMQQQTEPELFTSFKKQSSSSNNPPPLPQQSMKEPRAQFSIRGRSNTITRPAGLSIRGESGPSTVLISNLDPRTNSEDVKVSCENFGAILHCEVLRNSSGYSYGEAEVEFSSKSAALDCIAQFDNNMADGRILRAILREPKSTGSSFGSTQVRNSLTPSYPPSGKMYADQINNPRYDIRRN
ncbi:hypothetical protein K501DRAFT_226229 [Backusella circina FSU 941]|nr:hypothetical protein K501DRAFT_226229 [Backusella circina FSU 941]